MTTWLIGDRAVLVPTLPTAPAAAYRQPECRIVALTSTRVEIQLPDGRRLWTDQRNLAKRPRTPEPARPKTAPARRLVLADNEQEITLW